MKNLKFMAVFMLLGIWVFAFSGCSDDSSSSKKGLSVKTAADVKLSDLEVPTGDGIPPDDEKVDDFMADVFDALEEIENIIEGEIFKSVGSRLSGRLSGSEPAKAEKPRFGAIAVPPSGSGSDSDSDSWENETGLVNLTDHLDFTGGTAGYTSSGSWSWYEFWDYDNLERLKDIEEWSHNEESSYVYTNVAHNKIDFSFSGIENFNFAEEEYLEEIFNYNTREVVKDYEDFAMAVSARIGLSVSGDTFVCYVIMKGDFDIAFKGDWVDAPEDWETWFLNKVNVKGSITITIYDAAGNKVDERSFTGNDLLMFVMDKGKD